jgi:hypothetical protein
MRYLLLVSVISAALFANIGLLVALNATKYVMKLHGTTSMDKVMLSVPYFLRVESELKKMVDEERDRRAARLASLLQIAKWGFLLSMLATLASIPIWAASL